MGLKTASAATYSEGAENGTSGVTLQTSAGYNPFSINVYADGAPHSFHFAHPDGADQWMKLNPAITPQAGSVLSFKSRLAWAATGQTAHVQVSTDAGATWSNVYNQTGTDGAGESSLSERTVSLGGYAGQSIRIRFLYLRNPAMSAFQGTSDSGPYVFGWFVDQIQVLHPGVALPALSEGAENGTSGVTLQTSGVYNPFSISVYADGPPHSFHFAHPDGAEQWVKLNPAMTPQAGSVLSFKSRLAWASSGQTAHVQVSTDAGATWSNVYNQTGTDGAGEASLTERTVSLGGYAGQSIRIRFLYLRNPAMSAFQGTADSGTYVFGWFVDQIVISNVTLTGGSTNPPLITQQAFQNGTVAQAFSYQIAASNSPTSYGASGLPAGLSVNASTGLISGTPATAAVSTVTLSATNAGGTGSATLMLTVNPAAPQISSALIATATKGTPFSYQITASNNPTSYAASGLPVGLSVNASTGLISGTPTAAGASTVTLNATNAGGTGSATLTLTVNPLAPQITSAINTSAPKDQPFSYQIVATNSPTSYGATGLPVGLSVNASTGLISGTPTSIGTSTVTLAAANVTGIGNATLTITVAASPQPPSISATPFSVATVGQSFSYQIAASHSPTSYGASGLPAGLSVNASTGLISGTPSAAGQSQVTLIATNAVGTDSETLMLTVNPQPPVIGGTLSASASKGSSFTYQIIASNSPTSYGATGLPSGLSVNAATGLISGTPSDAGAFSVTLNAANSGGTDTKVLSLTVENVSSSAALNVAVVPEIGGSVTPEFAGSTEREIGASYTISAIPAPGYVFAGWSGSWSGNGPTVTFTMAQGFHLQANFALDPLLSARGEYHGLALANPPTHSTSGKVKIHVTLGGRFTGKLMLAGTEHPFAGVFGANGIATFGSVKRASRTLLRRGASPLELSLRLDVAANPSRRITGTITDAGAIVSSIDADQFLFTDATSPVAPRRNVPAELTGRYTFIFPGSLVNAVSMPRGNGWGLVRVAQDGSARVVGTLADGTDFACSTALAQDGTLPLYVPLYGNRGAICGQVSLVSNAGNDVSGGVVWFRPALPARALYPAGWPDGITLNLRGSHYAPPANAAAGEVSTAVILSLSGGNLTSLLTASASLSSNSLTLLQPLGSGGFSFAVNPATGVIRGRFFHPASESPRIFKGVLLQNQTSAAGFFLGATESGAIEIVPDTFN